MSSLGLETALNLSNFTQQSNHIVNEIFCGLSFISFSTTFVILCLYVYKENFRLSIPASIGILFFSAVVTTVAHLSYKEMDELEYDIYTTSIQFLVGILMFIGGSLVLFTNPRGREHSLGYHHEGIGVLIWSLVIPLVVVEFMILLGCITRKEITSAILTLISIAQKCIQAGLYNFSLQLKIPMRGKSQAASWFLKVIALLNVTMWLQSIMTSEARSNDELSNLFNITKTNSLISILTNSYAAFIIDYRLLCALLFLEHALEIDCAEEGERTYRFSRCPSTIPSYIDNDVYITNMLFKGLGVSLGFIFLVLTIINSLQYVTHLIPAWTDSFSMVTQISVAILGVFLIKQLPSDNSTDRSWRETSSIGVDLMVALMGIFAIAFWTLKGSLIVIFKIVLPNEEVMIQQPSPHYLPWQASKCFFRALCIISQIYMFTNVNSSIGRRREFFTNKWNFFLLPPIILGFFSIFLNSVVDSFGGFVEKIVHETDLNIAVAVVYQAGEPIYLGYCIHLFLHFLIVYRRMNKAVGSLNEQIRSQSRLQSRLSPLPEHQSEERDSKGSTEKLVVNERKDSFTNKFKSI